MPRRARQYSETGIYHIMLRGNEKKAIFVDKEDKEKFIEIVWNKKEIGSFLLYCYCVMDNHVHLIIKEEDETISQTIKRIGTSYAYYFNKKHKRVGHVFQDRFKSEAIETERYLLAAIRYIHKNPEKAGICPVEKYEWSSYQSYIEKNIKMSEVKEILNYFSKDLIKAQKLFKEFSNNKEYEYKTFLDTDADSEINEENFSEYFMEILKKHGINNQEELVKRENKSMREIIIKEMVEKSNCSLRKIADLSGLNREMIRKTVSKEPSP